MFNGLEFEKKIIEELEKSGIKTYINQKLYAHDTELDFDFLITNPTRSVFKYIYLKNSSADNLENLFSHYFEININKKYPPQSGFSSRVLIPAIKKFRSARSIFNENGIICFLILISDEGVFRKELIKQFENQNPDIKIIGLSLKRKEIEKIVVKQIKETLFKEAKTFNKSKYKLDSNIKFSQDFMPLLDNFQAILKNEDYDVFSKEVLSLDQEILKGHSICAALKIGRVLEFVVLTLAHSWDININKPVIKIIDDLDGNFSGLKNVLIDYTYAKENDKKVKKSKLVQRITEISNKLFELIGDLEEIKSTQDDNNLIPINLNAALKEVGKKYSKIVAVREELNILNKENYIKSLMELRNIAAHANVNGMNKDLEYKDIKEMKKNLLIVLLHLSNINNAIVNKNGIKIKI